VAKNLANHFLSIDAIMNADFETLIAVEDIGDKIAQSIIEYFSRTENIKLIEELKGFGLNFTSSNDTEFLSDNLEGKTFVVSGVFENYSRDNLKELIELHGGKNIGSISAKTSFVLAGENMGPAKLAKAKKLGVPIISISEFETMIHKKSPV
jgi:DNA ligase (NAD+)